MSLNPFASDFIPKTKQATRPESTPTSDLTPQRRGRSSCHLHSAAAVRAAASHPTDVHATYGLKPTSAQMTSPMTHLRSLPMATASSYDTQPIPDYPTTFVTPTTMRSPPVRRPMPTVPMPTASRMRIPAPMQQSQIRSIGGPILRTVPPPAKAKRKVDPILLRKHALKQLVSLFPSLPPKKLFGTLKSKSFNLKSAILAVKTDASFKGKFDKNVCVYNLSDSCKHCAADCRYTHDREVVSAVCEYWLKGVCLNDLRCDFLHRMPKPKVVASAKDINALWNAMTADKSKLKKPKIKATEKKTPLPKSKGRRKRKKGKGTKLEAVTKKGSAVVSRVEHSEVEHITDASILTLEDLCVGSLELDSAKTAASGVLNEAMLRSAEFLFLKAMFGTVSDLRLQSLLAQHSMAVKPVAATLMQEQLSEQSTASESTAVCKYFLLGECTRIDCPFRHERDAAAAVCKYWLWGHCARGDRCVYKHELPDLSSEMKHEMDRIQNDARQSEERRLTGLQMAQLAKVKRRPIGSIRPSDIVITLRVSQLRKQFPKAPEFAIRQTLEHCHFDDVSVMRAMSARFGKPKAAALPKPKLVIPHSVGVDLDKAKRRKAATTSSRMEWVQTGDAMHRMYKERRREAEEFAILRNRCFMQAVDAYSKGDGARAAALSADGRHYDAEMKGKHAKASKLIFERRNKQLGIAAMDLHGLHTGEALECVRRRVAELRGLKQRSLDVLTGTGHHSYGGCAKLLPAIRRLGADCSFRVTEITAGGKGGILRLRW